MLSPENTNENSPRIDVDYSDFYVVDLLLVRNLAQLTWIVMYSDGNNEKQAIANSHFRRARKFLGKTSRYSCI